MNYNDLHNGPQQLHMLNSVEVHSHFVGSQEWSLLILYRTSLPVSLVDSLGQRQSDNEQLNLYDTILPLVKHCRLQYTIKKRIQIDIEHCRQQYTIKERIQIDIEHCMQQYTIKKRRQIDIEYRYYFCNTPEHFKF